MIKNGVNMIGNSTQQRLLEQFPILHEATPEFHRALFHSATRMHIPEGHTIASEGSECQQLALVISGRVRVFKLAESGREITLYRILAGDSCVLTASCIMSDRHFPAIAQTENEVEAIIVPASFAKEWLTHSKPWCQFLFSLVSQRLGEVIGMLEDIAFHRMDERLAAYLIALASSGHSHQITHHQIASDLGTSREVISRIMKEFESKALVSGGRGELLIKDLAGLQNYTH